ncbi:hypothetical protein ACFY84_29940 [Streptomyces sp. NPDC012438]|uniref:hypothetical protein n=1 Tax=Streptomyces sp. NPDC012438 TaxID=3364833 RepID=UPI0036F10D33
MPEPRTVRIALGGPGRGTVEVGGADISHAVRAVHFDAVAGALPKVELELSVHDVSTQAEAQVYVPEETEAALIAMGWTPPPSEGHRGMALVLQDPANRDAVTEVLRHAARVGEPWFTDLINRWHRIESGRLPHG